MPVVLLQLVESMGDNPEVVVANRLNEEWSGHTIKRCVNVARTLNAQVGTMHVLLRNKFEFGRNSTTSTLLEVDQLRHGSRRRAIVRKMEQWLIWEWACFAEC